MACLHPIPMLDLGLDENGKHITKFLPRRYDTNLDMLKSKYGDMLLLVPCGKCIECRKKRADEWATRCLLESENYNINLFVTLTYDDDYLPDTVKELKTDFQKFIRSLRDRGFKLRYFGCGERGETGDRMHLHVILFGFDPCDLKPLVKNGLGQQWFSSQFLDDVWGKGFVSIGLATYETARYTAGYTAGVSKKTLFTLSSRKPAIGYDYYYANKDRFYETDSIEVGGRSCPVPRSFDNLAKKESLPSLECAKKRRRMLSDASLAANRRVNQIDTLDKVFIKKADNIKSKIERSIKK